jgi:hypothetical protein
MEFKKIERKEKETKTGEGMETLLKAQLYDNQWPGILST